MFRSDIIMATMDNTQQSCTSGHAAAPALKRGNDALYEDDGNMVLGDNDVPAGVSRFVRDNYRDTYMIKRDHFQCCVCLEPLKGDPIYKCNQCTRGILCGSCRGRVKACPVCRTTGNMHRFLFLEEVLNSISDAVCPNTGCKKQGTLVELSDHAKRCPFRMVKCFYCAKEVASNKLLFHWADEDDVVFVDTVNLLKCEKVGAYTRFLFTFKNYNLHVEYLGTVEDNEHTRYKLNVFGTDKAHAIQKVRFHLCETYRSCDVKDPTVDKFTNVYELWVNSGVLLIMGRSYREQFLNTFNNQRRVTKEISLRFNDVVEA